VDLSVIDPELPLTCIGKVGDDAYGAYILNLLRSRGIDSRFVLKSDSPTSYTDVMNDSGNGERTFFQFRGANADFSIDDVPFSEIRADIFHIGYALLLDLFDEPDSEYGTVMARALAMAQNAGMKTSMDVVSENGRRFVDLVTPSLKYCDYAIMNEVESGMTTGIPPRDESGQIIRSNLKDICKRMFDLGVNEYVVIHMPELGCAMDQAGKFYTSGSYILPEQYIKGAVGAGDAFCAGMLYALYQGWEIDEALRFANGAAACSLSAENSISGMKDRDAICALDFAVREDGIYESGNVWGG
jgi:sugar/nucleoside kinase (ribokinase family)